MPWTPTSWFRSTTSESPTRSTSPRSRGGPVSTTRQSSRISTRATRPARG
ncbi:hypothetical protein ACFFX0_18970 [Citricoccus parietis]|uniref:Uncharacterized protein n=1 Tax=Citricoccus parietis TaxID=592307 RepID=A0ABV5G3W9_9MICC